MSRKNEGETKKKSGFKLRETPIEAGATDEAHSTQPSAANPSAEIDHLGELPQSYGSDTIFLIAQEPHWLFTYWDIDISRHPGGKTFLRVYRDETSIEAEIEVPFETRNWYIPVKEAGAKYTVEIGYHRGSVWNVIARSHTIETPTDRLSESDQFNYATIPLHLSFQKLVEKIHDATKSGEPLMAALSRLQMEGKLFGPGALSKIPLEQRVVLETMLGSNFLEELASDTGLSSQQIEERIRKHLGEKLTSSDAMSSFSREQWGAAESSLFSALGAMSSGEVFSWSPAELSSWVTAVLSSWGGAAPSSAGWSGELLSSWTEGAQSSWGLSALSSWLQGAESSWAQAAISSWLQGAQGSWAQAALSSWGSAAVTSWSEAAVTSWSSASEWVSSFGVARNFFMNVNAEVIFYGGTDPRAKVTIDNKPITLNPDGTFRHHFIFPDGVYEIPIVAISPDGVESRSAILRFQRGTQKTGKVDDTLQPPLAPPMGSVS